MNELIQTSPRPQQPSSLIGSWLLPATATVLLHGVAAWALYSSWSPEAPARAPQTVMITQLVALPTPAPEPEPIPEPSPEPVVQAEPPAPVEPQVDQAEIARKRLQEQQREQEKQQRLAEQRRQQQLQREQERQQLAREQQEREQAEQQARAEQQRQAAAADARALAEAEAEAARRAAEAAAIAQYQPISKEPPSYPRRALDRGVEGDCTVRYTVTRDGRVKDPQVVEGACDDPMFERPSLNAANSFRYQPRLINGQPVDVPGISNTFRYRIQ